jgi:PEP-CTERM motif
MMFLLGVVKRFRIHSWLFAVTLLVLPNRAFAEPIGPGTWYWFQWGGDGWAVSGTMETSSGVLPPSAFGQAPGAPGWTLTAPDDGALLTVLDTSAYGDRFEVFDFGASLGLTSLVPAAPGTPPDDMALAFSPDVALANPNLSRGTFVLSPGDHSLMINAVINPWGGGGAWFRVDEISPVPDPTPVPEPSSVLLVASGGLGVLFRMRRRRSE